MKANAQAAVELSPGAQVWQEILAKKFIRFREVLIQGAQPHGMRALHAFRPQVGDRVVDVGCGFGDSTVELGHRVGREGAVVGLDVVDAFLEYGRREAVGLPQVRFELGDGQRVCLDEPADFVFSRFGSMFFDQPVLGFRNLAANLRPGGRLLLTTWRPLADNAWLALPKEIVLGLVPPPGPKALSCGPGPFSLSSPDVIQGILGAAGFREIELQRSDTSILVGRDLDEAVAFQLAIGPAGEALREAGELGQRRLPEIRSALAKALESYLCEEGVLMPSSAWIVTATHEPLPPA